jgi:hypothetical protein
LQLVGKRTQPRRGEPQTHAASGQSSTHSATANPVTTGQAPAGCPAAASGRPHCELPGTARSRTHSVSDDSNAPQAPSPRTLLPGTARSRTHSVSDDSNASQAPSPRASSKSRQPSSSSDSESSHDSHISASSEWLDHDSDNDPELDGHGRVVDDGDTDNPNRPASELQSRWSDVWHSQDTGADLSVLRRAAEQTAKLDRYMKKCIKEKKRYEEEVIRLTALRDEAQQKKRRNMLRIYMDKLIASIGSFAAAWNNQAHFTSKYQELHNNLIRLRRCRIVDKEASVLNNTWLAYPDPSMVDGGKNANLLWKEGIMGSNSGNYLRILCPLRTVAELFRVADLTVYTQSGHIQVNLDLLEDTTLHNDEIRWLTSRKVIPDETSPAHLRTAPHNITSLYKMFGGHPSAHLNKCHKIDNHLEFGTIEFSWNYDQYMSRFHLQTPTSSDAALHKGFLDDVLQTLRLSKQCQFMRQIRPPTDFPFTGLDDMPVVVWMKRAENRPARPAARETANWRAMGSQRRLPPWPTGSADHGRNQRQRQCDEQWQTGYTNRDTRNATWNWW